MWEGKVSDSNNPFKRHILDPCEIQKLVAEVWAPSDWKSLVFLFRAIRELIHNLN